MFQEALQTIDGVNVYPVVALLTFVLAFVSVLVWVWRLDKKVVAKVERLPLDSQTSDNSERR